MKRMNASPLAAPLAAAVVALLLSACQTTPAPGSDIRAQVHAVPLTRQALDHGADHGELHAALRAGATAADAAAQRVALASCALPEDGPDSGLSGRARLYTVTTVLPAGVSLQRGAVLQLKVDGDPFSATRIDGRFPAVHGRFVALAPAGRPLDENTGVPWRLLPGDTPRMLARCQPAGGEPGLVLAAHFRTVRDDEMKFAAAEAARHAQFSDAELAAGRVVRLLCRLRMADGGEWHSPEFLARAPAGLPLKAGDVVRLRAGVDENSRQGGPVGQVLAREQAAGASPQRSGVDCR
jgi:predicted small secreted protein